MTTFKKLTALVLCVLCLMGTVLLTACGGDKDDAASSDIEVTATIDEIYAAVSAVLPNAENLIDAQPTYLSMFFDGAKAEDFANHKIVMQSMSTSIDNVGIFEAKTKDDVKTIEAMVDTYLDFYENEVWDDTYLEEEFPKLQNAERVTMGKYVMYVILDADTRAAAITAFENACK